MNAIAVVLGMVVLVGADAARAQEAEVSLRIELVASREDVDLVVTDPSGYPVSLESHRSDVVGETVEGRMALEWPRPAAGAYLVCAIGSGTGSAAITLTVRYRGREASRTYERSGVLGRPCTRAASGFLIAIAIDDDVEPEPARSSDVDARPATPVVPGALDEVTLRDGTLLRGTLVEQSSERIVLLLPTGETRTHLAADVATVTRAGAAPTVSPEITMPRAEPRAERVAMPSSAPAPARPARLHVRSDTEGLALQQLVGSGSASVYVSGRYESVAIDHYTVLCTIPCDTEVASGTYVLGVSLGDGPAIRVGPPRSLIGDLDLNVTYVNRDALRVAGWVTFIVGGVLGATAVAIGGAWDSSASIPLLVTGGSVFLLSMAIGLPLAVIGDSADIEVSGDSSAVR